MRIQNEKGITLIALIVTIIVILILAAISINSGIFEDGLISRTAKSSEDYEIKQQVEMLQTLYAKRQSLNYTKGLSLDEFFDYLEKNDIKVALKNNINGKDEYVAEYEGNLFIIRENNGGVKFEYYNEGEVKEPRISNIKITDKTNNLVSIKVYAERANEYEYYISDNKDSFSEEPNAVINENEYTFTGIDEGKVYYIKVIAKNNDGESTKIISTKLKEDNNENDTEAPTRDIEPNSGTFALATEGTSKIRATIKNISDNKDAVKDIDKYYAWSQSNSVQPDNWTAFNSSTITVEKKQISDVGTWYLWTKLIDKSNNQAIEPSDYFEVREVSINIDTNVQGKATITYDTILTTNSRKAGFGETLDQAKANAVSNTAQEVTFNKNGYVYAEAEDSLGNKVSKFIKITSFIDKVTAVSISDKIVKKNEFVEIVPNLTGSDYKSIDFTISNTSIATIETSDGKYYVRGVAGGKTTVICTVTNNDNSQVTATANVSVADISYSRNGGTFALPYVDNVSGTCKIETNVVIQGATTSQYAFSTSNSEEPSSWTNYSSATGGKAETSTTEKNVTYYLWSKISDGAGNSVTYISNAFDVVDGKITLAANIPPPTWARDVTVSADWPDVISANKDLQSTGTSGEDYNTFGLSNVNVKTNNQTITAEGTDASGLNASTATYTVTNVDSIIPAGEVEKYSAAQVAANPTLFYGQKIENYVKEYDTNGNTWRVYFADNDNIYLIADDYLHKDYLPYVNNIYIPYSHNYNVISNNGYKYMFEEIYKYYMGAEDLTKSFSSAILSKWQKWAVANSTSRNANIRSVAYMMDKKVWNEFVDTSYADYAIASPTVEMFTKAYKDTHSSSTISYNENGTNGYTYLNATDLATDYNGIYVKTSTKTDGMWLTSPDNTSEESLVSIMNQAFSDYDYNAELSNGLRPVVCLKSTTKLVKQNEKFYLENSALYSENGDDNSPNLSIPTPISIQANKIEMTVNAQDSQSGITTIEWYYKKTTDEEYEQIDIENISATTQQLTKNIEITSLTANTAYNIKVVVSDAVGNQAKTEVTVTTLQSIVQYAEFARVPEHWKYVRTNEMRTNWYSYDYVDNSGQSVGISIVNEPVLADGMVPIRYENQSEYTNLYDGASSPYQINQGSHWANAVTQDGSMWVWIPRFAYRITNNYHNDSKGTIEIAFLKDETNEFLDSNITGTVISGDEVNSSVYGNPDKWILAPGFTFGDEELSGFWIAKYDASINTDSSNPDDMEDNGENINGYHFNTDNRNLVLQVKPNAVSWTNMVLSNIDKVCRNLARERWLYYFGNSNNANNVDTHLTKNVEWGAVAYLSHSRYGLNGNQIGINMDTNFLTGVGEEKRQVSNMKIDGSYTIVNGRATSGHYNNIYGINASTTKNVYGVYDMSGGAWDYVAGYTTQFAESGLLVGDEYNNEYFKKYADLYDEDVSTGYTFSKYGDAVYETSLHGNNVYDSSRNGGWRFDSSSWFDNFSNWFLGKYNENYIPNDNHYIYYRPVFIRGGNNSDQYNYPHSGMFAYSYAFGYGRSDTDLGFRPVCVVSRRVKEVTGFSVPDIVIDIDESQLLEEPSVIFFDGGVEYNSRKYKNITYEIANTSIAEIEDRNGDTYIVGKLGGITTLTCTVTNYDDTTVSKTVNVSVTDITYNTNGGTFALPYTNNNSSNATIQANITIAGATRAEYAFSTSKTNQPTNWSNCSNTGGSVTSSVSSTGTYYLWNRLSDLSGNSVVYVSDDEYVVVSGQITLAVSVQSPTLASQVTVTPTWPSVITTNKSITSTGTSGTDYIVDGTTSITVKKNNKTVTVTGKDASGLNTSTATYTVTNIDDQGATITDIPLLAASNIASNPSTYYGRTVKNYTCKNGEAVNAWKIFLADSDNIYLISDDYIHKDYIPDSANYTINAITNYKVSLNNVYQDYTGASDIVNNFSSTILTKWHKWVNANQTSTNPNVKGVAYLLDKNIWSVFANSDYADYAIGGPTVEMFATSYNQLYPEKTIQYANDTYGYKLKWSTDADYSTVLRDIQCENDIYIITSNTKAVGAWFASAANATNSSNNVEGSYFEGRLGTTNFTSNQNNGIRPIVCLKSNMSLKEVDGELYIVESQTSDHTKPQIGSPTPIDIQQDKIKVVVKAQDTGSGITTIKWYFKKSTDATYTELTGNQIAMSATTSEITRNTVINNLQAGQAYNIKVVVIDAFGNEASKISTVTTALPVAGTVVSAPYGSNWNTTIVNPTADGIGHTIPIPKGYYYVGGNENTGFVISSVAKDDLRNSKAGNQFVWVPVPDVIYDGTSTVTSGTYTPMAKLKSGSTTNYEGMLYSFSGTTATYSNNSVNINGTMYTDREPDIISDYDEGANDTVGITASNLQNEYNMMVSSVAQYGGFYVGRFETGLTSDGKAVSKNANVNSSTVTTAAAGNSLSNTWYGLYRIEKEYSQSGNVKSTMIWGSQYDAMMNWMARTGTAVGTQADTSKYNTTVVTGNNENDIINNVYDIYGCHYEWTMEANGTANRVRHGGNLTYKMAPSFRYNYNPTITNNGAGSRMTLYINSQ